MRGLIDEFRRGIGGRFIKGDNAVKSNKETHERVALRLEGELDPRINPAVGKSDLTRLHVM